MKRHFIVLALAVMLAACGQSDNSGEQTAQDTTTEQPNQVQVGKPQSTAGKSTEMIPMEEISEFEKAAQAKIRPFFNEEGTQTELAVAPGDYFDVYVFAEFNELYPMSAAEYKLTMPPGVSVMGTTQTDSVLISMGKWDTDFMIAFHCAPGPKMKLVKYNCKTHDDFAGGAITTSEGDNLKFLGFTLCDATKTLIRADGGEAAIKRK